jgi:integrase
MENLPDHVTSYFDRHGRIRYRYREKGKPARSLPGESGEPRFEAAYADATLGRAKVGRKPTAVIPRTLRAVFLEVQRTADWKNLDFGTRQNQISIAERFFALPIADGHKLLFGAMPVAGLRRGDIKKILGRYTDKPHAGAMVLRLIRKLTVTALDLEWIEADPTYKLKYRPKLKGHRAWTDAELQAYEAKWQPGTIEYLGYALALYTGQRRGDLAAMRWSAFDGAGIAVVQQKTDAPLWIPVHPNLAEILAITPRRADTILATAYGSPYTRFGFGNKMAEAIDGAELPAECRLHGLRKSAGRCLAEAGATTRQIMAVLGHKSLSEAEHYTREAEQKRLAQQGMDQWLRPRLTVVGGRDAT